MGDLEISVVHLIYDCIVYIFELYFNNEIRLINIYGDINNTDKNIINLCFVNNNHYIVLYEANRTNNILSEINWNDVKYLRFKNSEYINKKNTLENDRNLFNKFTFANDTRNIKYIDIINYLIKSEKNLDIRYPEYMYKIEPYKRRKNLKHKFRRYCKKYKIDKKTNRLQREFVFLDKKGNQNKKSYFIAYLKEKKLIIDNLHKLSCHRGINTLYNLIMEQEFYWYNIISDVNIILVIALYVKKFTKLPIKSQK